MKKLLYPITFILSIPAGMLLGVIGIIVITYYWTFKPEKIKEWKLL
jgi:hypothetical protein